MPEHRGLIHRQVRAKCGLNAADVFLELLEYADDCEPRRTFVANATIAATLLVDRETIRRAIQRLTVAGFVVDSGDRVPNTQGRPTAVLHVIPPQNTHAPPRLRVLSGGVPSGP